MTIWGLIDVARLQPNLSSVANNLKEKENTGSAVGYRENSLNISSGLAAEVTVLNRNVLKQTRSAKLQIPVNEIQ